MVCGVVSRSFILLGGASCLASANIIVNTLSELIPNYAKITVINCNTRLFPLLIKCCIIVPNKINQSLSATQNLE